LPPTGLLQPARSARLPSSVPERGSGGLGRYMRAADAWPGLQVRRTQWSALGSGRGSRSSGL